MTSIENRNLVRSGTLATLGLSVFQALERASSLWHKFVTYAMYRAKMHRIGRILFQFLSQLQNVVIDGPGRRIILVPQHLQQFLSRYDSLCILHEELEYFEFLRGECDRIIFSRDLHFSEVHGDRIKSHRIWQMGRVCASNDRSDSSKKLLRAERLGYVVVSSQFQQQNLIGNVRCRTQNDDGQARVLALDFATNVFSRQGRQSKIENDGCRGCRSEGLQRRLAVGPQVNLVAFWFKQPLQAPLNGQIIFND